LLILFIVVVLLVTLDAKYSENEYFPNPSLTSLATFFTQVFFPVVFLIHVAKPFPHSSCPTAMAMMAVMVETMAAAVIAAIMTTKKKQQPLR
jgi:hypothetical protein